MVVVGSRWQGRISVCGANAGSSGAAGAGCGGVSGVLSSANRRPEASPARELPRKIRREGVDIASEAGVGERAGVLGIVRWGRRAGKWNVDRERPLAATVAGAPPG